MYRPVKKRAMSGTKKKPAIGRRKTTRRRRRISGIGKIDAKGIGMQVVGLTIGAAGGRELNAILVKQFPTLTPTVSGLIQIGVGVLLPMVVKGNALVANIGNGMIANGGMVELVNLGVISGVRPSAMSYRINGSSQLSSIAGGGRFHRLSGASDLSAVAGMPKRRKISGNRCY